MNTAFRILFCLVLSTSFQLSAQVDSTLIDGKYYKIYPIREKINIPIEYWKAVKDDAYFEDPDNYFNVFGEGKFFNRAVFDTSALFIQAGLHEDLATYWKNITSWELGMGPRFKKAVRKNPSSIVSPNYTLNQDVLPPFGAIPDGEYVQLFNNFCLVDSKGQCQEQTDRVAAFFGIKNNALHGDAVWLDLNGDVIKKGNFEDGLRSGTWTFKDWNGIGPYISRWNARDLKKNGAIYADTASFELHYLGGVLNGPYSYKNPSESLKIQGEYADGNPTGNWRTYFEDTLIYNITHADKNNSVRSHKPIIRTSEFLNQNSYLYNTQSYEYGLYAIPSRLFEIDFGIDKELELEEEEFQSHELEYRRDPYNRVEMPTRITDRGYNDSYQYRYNYSLYDFIQDPNREISETRGYFIDSIGAKIKYDGAYEVFYPNGQLYTRYLFENGELKEEGTLYWDNGQAYDVIEFNADSNKYFRRVYDYDGEKMNTAIYDSLGDFLRYDIDIKKRPTIEVDGLVATLEQDELYYTPLYKLDTLLPGNYTYVAKNVFDSIIPSGKILLNRAYNGYDKKSVVYERTFDPDTRVMEMYRKSYTGNQFYTNEITFTENFESWNGKSSWKFGRFEVVTTSSAIIDDVYKRDSMQIKNALYPTYMYSVTEDVELFLDGELYTGPMKLKTGKKFKYRKNKLILQEGYREHSRRTARKLYKYLTTGKHKDDLELSIINSGEDCEEVEEQLSENLFTQANSGFFYYHGSYNRYDNYGYAHQARNIKGQLFEGKPQGEWIGKKGLKKTNEINFNRGEPFGTYKQYAFEPRSSKFSRQTSVDSLPKSRVHFLDISEEYVNGLRQGDYRDYNWYGGIEEEGQSVDDAREGTFIRRMPMAYSVSEFKRGYLDGYVQTFLTLPNMDTLLLYDLNFQDGNLNGESVSYHTNGKVSKRGFFLAGEPIDDYQAYDTLGFRYHYVKFQYGFPVEEKIWEENELSLRYRFDWEDSINFDPSDITNSMSLEVLLSRLGYGRFSPDEMYYGRPRLINKADLEYHMTKFYPNDTIARIGKIIDGKKVGDWKFYDYNGTFLYEVDYADTILHLNDSVRFKSKGILTNYNAAGEATFKAHIIEKMEKYDCAHTDHYEIRQLYTIWEASDTVGRMNGFVQNFYDNGVLQNEGYMENGLPTGLWKYYDPFGKLNLMGSFHQGKRHGRWLQGDLEKKKYLGEICLNPNLPDLEAEKMYRENLLDVTIITYYLGQAKSKQFFDLNMNRYSDLIE